MKVKTMDGVIVAPKQVLNILSYGYMQMAESHRKDGYKSRANEMFKISLEIEHALNETGYYNV